MDTITFDGLGARELLESSKKTFAIENVQSELDFKFPPEYSTVLEEFKGPIVFNNGATFKPIQETPVDSENGFLSLEILYGLRGNSNLIDKNNMYNEQIPSNLITIGESSGGDQICLSCKTGKVYFWYHEAKTEEYSAYEISNNIIEFFSSLKKDDEQHEIKKDIDESGSFLEF
ncbi:SMI1/KNR4 family protein [Microbulbifer rhizosphaerae]|uniref:Knr4/Smi1-like domain-containing protein n=1 Tax=Microbulbifer rhizosphaerae TaxID=1562603 RepID=A0A7W4W979_9GAMM|nr:SMI1/KNR4 family protein [Microbulbifer rhizosphaerae]MBB3059784.1 hypothetical protein [Microbulbifer rhizosphaerae]